MRWSLVCKLSYWTLLRDYAQGGRVLLAAQSYTPTMTVPLGVTRHSIAPAEVTIW